MRHKAVWGVILAAVLLVLVVGIGGTALRITGTAAAGSTTQQAYAPHINPSEFATTIDNKYFPLKPGTTFVYKGNSGGDPERDVMSVTHSTKRIMGVKCVVVKDRVFAQGKLGEKTFDWYAQDNKGNVWYFGENSKEYKNGHVVSTGGSWEAGKAGAKPGIIMQAHPKVGQTYRQEYSKGSAEDMARVLKLNGSAKVPDGSFHHVLVSKEWTPLEPGVAEHKYYAAGVGNIKEVSVKGPSETLELVGVNHIG